MRQIPRLTVGTARARLNKLADLGALIFGNPDHIGMLRLDVAATRLLELGEVRCPNCEGDGTVGKLDRECDICDGRGETEFSPDLVADLDARVIADIRAELHV